VLPGVARAAAGRGVPRGAEAEVCFFPQAVPSSSAMQAADEMRKDAERGIRVRSI